MKKEVLHMSVQTSVSKTLASIKAEVEQNKKLLVEDLKKTSKKELADLPANLSQKEKIDYIYKVQPHYTQIYKLVSQGYKKADIAEVLSITQVAFRNMCREIPELKAVLEVGKEDLYDEVEKSLMQLATGYEVEEEIINPFDGELVKLKKYVAPGLGAIKYVLGNKRGEEYADKREIIKKVELGADIKEALMSITTEDLQELLAMSGKADVANALDAEFKEKDADDGENENEE